LEIIQLELQQAPQTLSALHDVLQKLNRLASDITFPQTADAEFHWWAKALQHVILAHRDDLTSIAPWVSLTSLPQAKPASLAERWKALDDSLRRLDEAATLRQVAMAQPALLPMIDAIIGDFTDLSPASR